MQIEGRVGSGRSETIPEWVRTMADSNQRESESTGDLDRRTMLKGAAAAGMAGTALSGTASAHSNTIDFLADDDGALVYRFSVSGEIERGGRFDTDDGDEILDDHTAEGAVANGRGDSFTFSGELRSLHTEGRGAVFVNGKLVRDTREKSKPEPLPNAITIRGRGKEVAYKFRVSGRVEKGKTAGDTDEVIGDDEVRGTVTNDRDDYRYSGSISFESTDAPLTVVLDLNRDD